MITAYHRPATLDEALALLAQPDMFPLGGGTALNRPSLDKFSVVDLQALGLDTVSSRGNNLEIGSTVTLQQLLDDSHTSAALKTAIKLETTYNLRQIATVAGTLVSCDGRSPFTTAMLALDTRLTMDRGPRTENRHSSSVLGLGDFLPLRPKGLITKIIIPLNVNFAYEQIARTPTDLPIVCAALAQWTSGRTRLALGGYGKSPLLAMDGDLSPSPIGRGTQGEGIEPAARNAFHEANDEWASAEYRMEMASVLAKRCAERM
jgi:CO/xanthine dehydrogenase FAD-binding subunit